MLKEKVMLIFLQLILLYKFYNRSGLNFKESYVNSERKIVFNIPNSNHPDKNNPMVQTIARLPT